MDKTNEVMAALKNYKIGTCNICHEEVYIKKEHPRSTIWFSICQDCITQNNLDPNRDVITRKVNK